MNCPHCDDQRLSKEKGPHGIEIDRCGACRGLWLDRGEVFHYSERGKALRLMLDEGFEFRQPSRRSCPRCSKEMGQGAVGPQRVLLDMCEDCGGLWLDDEELDTLLSTLPPPQG